MTDEALWLGDETITQQRHDGNASWRIARPDVFSVRRTSVEDYLQPMVHEVKVSRADLLSDLRHSAKRESYQQRVNAYYAEKFGHPPLKLVVLSVSYSSDTTRTIGDIDFVLTKDEPLSKWMVYDFGGDWNAGL